MPVTVNHSTPADGSFSATGAAAWDAGHVVSGAASSGANSDITSLTGLTTPLGVAYGGTGAATLTGLVYGDGTSAFTAASSANVTTALGYTPVNQAGDTMTGKLTAAASSGAGAGFNITPGTAPTGPTNGDIWTVTGAATMLARLNGTTRTFATLEQAQTFSGNNTFSGATNTFGSSTATGTIGLASGALASGNTKTVNIGTAGLSGSTTNITLGATAGSSTTTLNGSTVATGTIQMAAFTVATLPAAGTAGRRAYVTDATGPTFLGALIGGGATRCPVFDNGTSWVAG